MNYLIFIAFFLYALSILIVGLWSHAFLAQSKEKILHKFLFLGEALLLGGVIVVGELLMLSMLHLYKGPILWGTILANFLFLLNAQTRQSLGLLFSNIKLSWPGMLFCVLSGVFLFRNCYFLVDVDSQTSYLYFQKLWLHYKTSFWASQALDVRAFVPHFDAVPYALGIALFGQDTLFAQLVGWFWRWIALVLVFGYVTYRSHGWLGLAAMMLVLFNDHFFYSGANQAVILNGALIALIFAVTYNFWEARTQNSSFRFVLGIIFLSQLLSNKYQMVYITPMLLLLGSMIQSNPFAKIKQIFSQKNYCIIFSLAVVMTSLWFLKNLILTGNPVFPILAGKFHNLGWTPEMEYVFRGYFRGLTLGEFMKYTNYLFIWPGVNPAKIVSILITFLPFVLLVSSVRKAFDQEKFFELCWWLGVSIAILMGICLTSHQDPRYFRFGIGVSAFCAVLGIRYVFTQCLLIKNELMIGLFLFVLALTGIKVVNQDEGTMKRPSFQNNIDVLLNKIHMDYAIKRHYPMTALAKKLLEENPEKLSKAAWDADGHHGLSPFLLPVSPQVGLWFTSVVAWDSYADTSKVVNDLREAGIEWIMSGDTDTEGVEIIPIEEYAKRAVAYNRLPKRIAFPYTMPPELTNSKL